MGIREKIPAKSAKKTQSFYYKVLKKSVSDIKTFFRINFGKTDLT